jgi:hypothetical protein
MTAQQMSASPEASTSHSQAGEYHVSMGRVALPFRQMSILYFTVFCHQYDTCLTLLITDSLKRRSLHIFSL